MWEIATTESEYAVYFDQQKIGNTWLLLEYGQIIELENKKYVVIERNDKKKKYRVDHKTN